MLTTYPFSLIIPVIYFHGVMQRHLKHNTVALRDLTKIQKSQFHPKQFTN